MQIIAESENVFIQFLIGEWKITTLYHLARDLYGTNSSKLVVILFRVGNTYDILIANSNYFKTLLSVNTVIPAIANYQQILK